MSMVTNAKVRDPKISEMIEHFLAEQAIKGIEVKISAYHAHIKLPKTKHAGKANYGMKSRRYA